MLQGTQRPTPLSARDKATSGTCGDFTTVDENREPCVTLSFRKAPSLNDNHVFCCGLTSSFDQCTSAILSGLVLLVTVV